MFKESIHTFLPSYAIFWCRRSSDVNRISKPFMELFGIGMKIWDIFLPHKKGPDEEWWFDWTLVGNIVFLAFRKININIIIEPTNFWLAKLFILLQSRFIQNMLKFPWKKVWAGPKPTWSILILFIDWFTGRNSKFRSNIRNFILYTNYSEKYLSNT